MGLLNRFAKSLKATAPIFGQLAQYSMIQGADEKKYNRLLEAEERKWGRDLELYEMKKSDASATAAAEAKREYYKSKQTLLMDGIKSLNSTLAGISKRPDGTALPLSEDEIALKNSILSRIKTYENAINQIDLMYRGDLGIEVDITGIEDALMYEAIDKAILEGDALEEINQAKESMFEGIGSPLDVTDQSSFGFGGKPLSIEKDIIEDQIKTLEEVISEDPLYGRMKYELKDEHKDYYRSKLGSLSRKEPEGTEEKKDEDVETTTEIIPPKENLRAMTQEDLDTFTKDIILYGNPDSKVTKVLKWATGIEGIQYLWRVLMETGDKIWRERLLEMGIDPDATPDFKKQKSNESAFVAPSDDSIQKMIESFTEAQRIA